MRLFFARWCRPEGVGALFVALTIAALACSDAANTTAGVADGDTGTNTVDVGLNLDVGGGATLDSGAATDGGTPVVDGGGSDSGAADVAAAADSQGGTLDVGNGSPDGAVADAEEEDVQCLGTIYPTDGQIDPDNPVYSSEWQTQEETEKMFAQAKADGTNAYKAYKAAFENPEVLLCAFCPCGCHESAKHVSAMDCFKDLHGFG